MRPRPTAPTPMSRSCFALFHDSMRLNDGRDPGHGHRGGALAHELRELQLLSDDQLRPLRLAQQASAGHTDGLVSADPTIGVCWDADRLDLPRVEITRDTKVMSTKAGRRPAGNRRRRGRVGRLDETAQDRIRLLVASVPWRATDYVALHEYVMARLDRETELRGPPQRELVEGRRGLTRRPAKVRRWDQKAKDEARLCTSDATRQRPSSHV